jgi:hypothetical protein
MKDSKETFKSGGTEVKCHMEQHYRYRCAPLIHFERQIPSHIPYLALVLLGDGHKGRVRTAKAHRHTETLRRADDDVGAKLARRLQHGQREQIGRDDEQCAARVQTLREVAELRDDAVRVRVLHERAAHVVCGERRARVRGGQTRAESVQKGKRE